jgi:hypothetical protein
LVKGRVQDAWVGFGMPGLLRKLYAEFTVNFPVVVRFHISLFWVPRFVVAFISGQIFCGSLKKKVSVVVVVGSCGDGISWLSSSNIVFYRDSSLLSAGHIHLVRRVQFCSLMLVTPNPPYCFDRVTRFQGTRQCPPEKFAVAPLHKNFLVILVRVWTTHVGRRNACM